MPTFNLGGNLEKLQKIQSWESAKPTTDLEWAEDVKNESLNVKYDYQLKEMKESHEAKLPKAEKDLDIFINWSDVERYKLTERFTQLFKDNGIKENGKLEGKTLKDWIDEEFESQKTYYQWKVAKLKQSIERIDKEIDLRERKIVVPDKLDDKSENKEVPKDAIVRKILGTVYYVDPVNGLATNTGTKLTGTIDSTADTTHATDNAWTGANDYINGSYFYNSTRGIGAYVSDFDAASDTITLASAIAGMTAGDSYYMLCSWLDLDTFTENARSAGDRCVVRRTAAAQCDNGSDLTFTSDGTLVAPIVLESDYDDEYHDKTDLSGTGTATLTFGSKTVTFSADISGVLAAGDWIYASGDNVREFAYEVASVDTVTVTLYLPYKGDQAGSGKTMYNIQDNPVWNSAAGDFQWNIDTDNFWKIQGLTIRGTDTNGQVEIDSSVGIEFIDCVFIGNKGDFGMFLSDDQVMLYVKKCRFYNYDRALMTNAADVFGKVIIESTIFSAQSEQTNRMAIGTGAAGANYMNFEINEVEMVGSEKYGIYWNSTNLSGILNTAKIRNSILKGSSALISGTTGYFDKIDVEDHQNVIGVTLQQKSLDTDTTDSKILQSETTTVRSGGSDISLKITPSTNLNNIWNFSKLLLFELPIYATTDSKTYTVYFNLPDANFSVDPTASELWIELEAWGHASNNYRKITKSSGTITDDGNWNALTVTVAPAQAGMAYLRCYYCKTKEAGSNIFYVDPIPVIS